VARTPTADIKPSLLTWARETINLSIEEAAKKIGTTPERLSEWESGERAPTIAQLRSAASTYKRPLAVFFLPEPPRDFQALHDFRRLPGEGEPDWSPGLHVAVRRARRQQEIALELMELLGEEPPSLPAVSAATDPETFARRARELLGISLEEQFSWRDQYRALTSWIEALEDAGVLVLQASRIPVKEMRGFSVADHRVPAIVLNAGDSPRGRIFTALHEWTHLLLRATGVCNLRERRDATSRDERIEVFCNQVSASTLMPRSVFVEEPTLRHRPQGGRWTDDQIGVLAEKYSVSGEAVLRRLVSLEMTSWDYYLAKRREYREAYEQRASESTGFPPYARRQVRDMGRAYVRLVLDAYHGDQINTSELADYLETKVKNIPKIEAEAIRTPAER
jgi:Zn-dependent peptidase ImmA (M78 family)/transcriptional regulator with XRE-family HTH domain